ncbi:hypothetical protein BDR26DRAFT_674685 [Obelidium mucronatum]|nr:hypothetical protein BDR26DRAFT_674685 [Obelidium mucronatum]
MSLWLHRLDQMCLVWVMTVLAICVLLQFVKFVWHFVLVEKRRLVGLAQFRKTRGMRKSVVGHAGVGSVAFISPNNTTFLTAMS